MSQDNFEARLSWLKQQAETMIAWKAAGYPVDDPYDTYPNELFSAAASPEFILELIKRLEAS